MLKTTIGGVAIDTCIYNASGPRSGTKEALEKIAESRSGVVLSKSCTLNEQKGNPLPRSINSVNMGSSYCHGSLNSEGITPTINYRYHYYCSYRIT